MNKFRIKTTCGIAKYNELKINKTLLGKFRFYWFNFFARVRDLFK